MNFFRIKEPIQQVGPNKFVIGDNPLKPQMEIGEGSVHIPQNLTISGINFLDYLTGDEDFFNLIKNTFKQTRYQLKEAFEINEDGDIVPSDAGLISDPMWLLSNENDLELRSNVWRINAGPESFTDEISF